MPQSESAAFFQRNDFTNNGVVQHHMTVVRMEVPCCGGIECAAKKALQNSGKFIPWSVVTISTNGKILEE